MKVLLIQPPHHNKAFAFAYATEPLALETLAATLDQDEVELLDLRFSTTPFEEVLSRSGPDIVATGGAGVPSAAEAHLPVGADAG